jgi:hypothetical protein
VNPAAVAVMVTVWFPSVMPSETLAMGNVALLVPAGMVTVAGTVASVVLSEARFTTSAAPVSVFLVTVPVVAGLRPSGTRSSTMKTLSVGPSSSVTVRMSGVVARNAVP